jgi:hypothetical protein
MIKLKNRDALISKLKPLEAKGKVKINYDTGEVELLGKSEEKIKLFLVNLCIPIQERVLMY